MHDWIEHESEREYIYQVLFHIMKAYKNVKCRTMLKEG